MKAGYSPASPACRRLEVVPGVRANDNVNLTVKPGEVHALLGENGAGKSTLVKMIYGILAPDEGQIIFDGSRSNLNPRAVRRLGIGMVFQHFSLFEAMTVLENIALGLDSRLSPRELLSSSTRCSRPTSQARSAPNVSTLSVGERQRIEIVRALLLNPRLLIMDEPTSVLTPQEVEQLFETLKKLASNGCSILYISHKLLRSWRCATPRRSCARQGGGELRSEARDLALDGRNDDRRQSEGDRQAGGTASSGRPKALRR